MMARPEASNKTTQLTKRDVGYFFSFSIELGKPGDRQKLTISGNEYMYETAMTRLRETKLRLMELAITTAENLAKPKPIEFPQEEEPLY